MIKSGHSLRKIVYGIMFIIIMFSPAISFAKPVISVFTDEAYPLSYTENGQPDVKGYATELVKAILDDAGLEYSISVRPFARSLREAKREKNTLIYTIGRLPELENDFIWLGQIIEFNQYIYGLSKNKHLKSGSLENLKNCAIGVINNDTRHQYFVKNDFTNIVIANSYEHLHTLLLRDRIQCFGATPSGVHYFAKHYKLSDDYFAPLIALTDLQNKLYFATSVFTSKEIVIRIKASYKKIIENGTYLRIMKPMIDLRRQLESTE